MKVIEQTTNPQIGDPQKANTENHNLQEEKSISINFLKTSTREGKTEL